MIRLQDKLKWQREICRIDEYHRQGYTGKGIKVLCHENTDHGRRAMEVLKQVAPDVDIVYASVRERVQGGKLSKFEWCINGSIYSFAEVMETYTPDIISCSLRSLADSALRDEIVSPYVDRGDIIIVTSAGNEGVEGGVQTRYPCGLTIGACEFKNGNKNNIQIASYSGRTQNKLDIDYVGFMGDWDGTSASTPFVAGQIALFLQRFGKMSQSEFQKAIKPHCRDLGEKGKDWIFGEGLIILPDRIEGVLDLASFKDVEEKRWSKKYIDKVCEEGLMKGISEDEFAPSKPMTREEVATVLCRALYGME